MFGVERRRLHLEARRLPSARKEQEVAAVPTPDGNGIRDSIGGGMRTASISWQDVFPSLQKEQGEVSTPTPTHLDSQCSEQRGEAAQATDSFVHMQSQSI